MRTITRAMLVVAIVGTLVGCSSEDDDAVDRSEAL
jgi:hypothetical protein